MNSSLSRLTRLLAAAGGLAVSTSLATPPATEAMAYPVREVNLPNSMTITVGTEEFVVRRNLGHPTQRFGADTVAYRGFGADLPEANRRRCGILLITFDHARVSDLKLVNPPAIRALAAHLRKGHPRIESAFLRLGPASFDLTAAPETAGR